MQIPALTKAFTNIMAEPSRMGISSLSISTRALDIPRPEKAANRCSTVLTDTPLSFVKVVHNSPKSMFLKLAFIKDLSSSTSNLLNTIPWSAGAGLMLTLTGLPRWTPTPDIITFFFYCFFQN